MNFSVQLQMSILVFVIWTCRRQGYQAKKKAKNMKNAKIGVNSRKFRYLVRTAIPLRICKHPSWKWFSLALWCEGILNPNSQNVCLHLLLTPFCIFPISNFLLSSHDVIATLHWWGSRHKWTSAAACRDSPEIDLIKLYS